MSKMWRAADLQTIKSWIDTIFEEAEEKLTDWERDFVTSVQARNNLGRDLTQKQEEILERIYSEALG